MIEATRIKMSSIRFWGVAALVGLLVAVVATNLAFSASDTTSVHPIAATFFMGFIVLGAVRSVAGDDARLRLILVLGFGAKMVGMLARYQISISVYGGLYDAGFYHNSASQIADWIHADGFVPRSDPRVNFRGTETTNLAYSLGWLYYVTGPRVLTAFVVASSMSYLGMLAFVKAGIEAVPNLDRHRYALLVVFLPTLVYWPSSIGKEAWMLCWLGVGAVGTARICRGNLGLRNLFFVALGFGAAAWIRPHVGALALASLACALIWPTGMKGRRVQQVAALVLVSLAFILAWNAVLSTFEGFLASESSDFAAILEGTTSQSSTGGSEFAAKPVTDPLSFAQAFVTVLFRPLPWEATSAVQLLTSLEGFALIGLGVASRHRLAALPTNFVRAVYVRVAVIYTIGFVIAYASIGNFGILARQRSQVWPLLLVVFALRPKAEPAAGVPNDHDRQRRPLRAATGGP